MDEVPCIFDNFNSSVFGTYTADVILVNRLCMFPQSFDVLLLFVCMTLISKSRLSFQLNVSFLTVSASRLSATPKLHAFSQIEHLKTSRKWR